MRKLDLIMKNVCYTCLFLFAITSMSVNASEDMRWSFKGFGTLAFTGTDTNEIGFYRSITQDHEATTSWSAITDSRLGLQGDVDINQSLHATVQWVARDHTGDTFEQNLDLAFLRWNVNDESQVKLGRLGADLFLLSDFRNIGYVFIRGRDLPMNFMQTCLFIILMA